VSNVADHWTARQRRSWASPRQPRRCRERLAAALALGSLIGCAHYQAAPLEPDRSAQLFAARRLTDPRLADALKPLLSQAGTAWPPEAWGRAELLAVALTQNPELAVARAQIRAALAHEITAAQLPNPDLLLQSEYAIHDTHPWLYGIEFDWLLRSPERRRLEIDIARLDTQNARLQLLDQAWSVRHTLAAALSDAESGRRSLALLDGLAKAQDKLSVFEHHRVAAGEDSPSELLTVQRVRIEIEQQESEQRALVDSSRAAAAKALGMPPQALDGIALVWPDWGEPSAIDDEQLRARSEEALLSRADLSAAIGEYSMAERKFHLAVARQYPELTLGPGYYWDHGIAKFPFDVGFTLPFNGNRGEIAEARADRDLAGQKMLALQADIYGSIESAGRAERIARSNADAAERQLKAARQQESHVDMGVRLGASDSLEQLGAQIASARAELALVALRAQLQNSRNLLEDALHTPLSGPELALAKSVSGMSGKGS
jgi:outer membrane protein, heavy metal efflux system